MKTLAECRVLIVDDAKANIDILVDGLKADHKLSIALNGESALQLAARNPPDLVLLDIMMPGLDGYEVCRRLRRLPETAEVPIMFLSSLEEVQDKARGFEAGGNDYLTKPFELLEVKARVRSLLKAKAYNDAVKEQIAGELRVAREIQMGMLPHDFAPVEEAYGVRIGAILEPAREVGGDLYEVLKLADGRVFVAVGDVSGKGIPAALFMAVTTTLLRTMARHCTRTEEILLQVNDALAEQNPRNMFVTLVCLIIDPATGSVTCANAGHPSPVLIRPGAAPQAVLTSTAMLAGVMAGIDVGTVTLVLQPGETLVLYTDGVTEAARLDGAMLEEKGLLQCLGMGVNQEAAETVAHVVAAVHEYSAGCPQSDDLTVLAIRRKP